MLTKEKLAERNKSIGSSEAAAVLGLSRWETPLSVWARKTGNLPNDDKETLPKEIGNELEDLVCRLFTKRTGHKVRRVNETLVHQKHSFITANIDRRLEGTDEILEAKTASGWKAKEWAGEDVPREYIIQCMHQLAVTGKKSCWIAVLIGGNQDFIYKCLPRDEEMIQKIIKEEVRFWKEFVEKNVMPIAISSDTETLNALFPSGDEGQEVQLDDRANILIESRSALLQDKKVCEDQLKKVDNEIKGKLGEAAVGLTDKYRITWKNVIVPAHSVKESNSRRLKVTELGKKD